MSNDNADIGEYDYILYTNPQSMVTLKHINLNLNVQVHCKTPNGRYLPVETFSARSNAEIKDAINRAMDLCAELNASAEQRAHYIDMFTD